MKTADITAGLEVETRFASLVDANTPLSRRRQRKPMTRLRKGVVGTTRHEDGTFDVVVTFEQRFLGRDAPGSKVEVVQLRPAQITRPWTEAEAERTEDERLAAEQRAERARQEAEFRERERAEQAEWERIFGSHIEELRAACEPLDIDVEAHRRRADCGVGDVVALIRFSGSVGVLAELAIAAVRESYDFLQMIPRSTAWSRAGILAAARPTQVREAFTERSHLDAYECAIGDLTKLTYAARFLARSGDR